MENTKYLGKTIVIRGDISADEDMVIDGKVNGRLEVSRNLTIGETGDIDADVKASNLKLDGRLVGTIRASDCVEIGKNAFFEGTLVSPRLSIADGAYFKGNVDMTGKESPGAAPKTKGDAPAGADDGYPGKKART